MPRLNTSIQLIKSAFLLMIATGLIGLSSLVIAESMDQQVELPQFQEHLEDYSRTYDATLSAIDGATNLQQQWESANAQDDEIERLQAISQLKEHMGEIVAELEASEKNMKHQLQDAADIYRHRVNAKGGEVKLLKSHQEHKRENMLLNETAQRIYRKAIAKNSLSKDMVKFYINKSRLSLSKNRLRAPELSKYSSAYTVETIYKHMTRINQSLMLVMDTKDIVKQMSDMISTASKMKASSMAYRDVMQTMPDLLSDKGFDSFVSFLDNLAGTGDKQSVGNASQPDSFDPFSPEHYR